MKKILLFGATGEIGMYLTDYVNENLKGKNYELIAVGKRKTDFFDRYGIKYYSVDMSVSEDFEKLPGEDVYAVIVLAGILPAKMSGYHPMQYIDVNIKGILNILEYCKRTGADRILYSQTVRDIGNLIGKEILRSNAERNFSYVGDHAVYVISKNAAVDLIEHYHQEYGLKRFIFRLPTIYMYSPVDTYYVDGQMKKMAYRLFIEQAMEGKPIEMWGNPEQAHDVVYVKDLCQLFFRALLADREGGIYNVGTGKPVSLKEQIEGIIDVFCQDGKESEVVLCPTKPNARDYRIDIQDAIDDFGYSPQYDYISYLKDFKEEMNLNRFKDLFEC